LTALNAIARTHDRRGNLLSNVQTGETLLYSWDDESQLTSVRVDPQSSLAVQSWRIDFVYDGLRRLRRMVQFTWNGSAWTSQGEVRYLYDGMLMVQERNAGNAPQVQYSRGVDLSGTIHGAGGIGGLLMRSHGLSGTNWTSHNAYHSDANGNVTALVNSSGVLQASYRYNPYGGLISSSGALASANRMRFSSKPAILSATGAWGFYYYGYRFYDPLNQRWLNRDPLGEGGGINLYGFVENNPVSNLDAYGLIGMPDPIMPNLVGILDPCCILGQYVKYVARYIRYRYNDMLRDKGGLYGSKLKGPMSWEGHQQQMVGWQNHLKKILKKMNDLGCGPGIPFVNVEANRAVPVRPWHAEMVINQNAGQTWPLLVPGSPAALETAGDVATGIGVAAGGAAVIIAAPQAVPLILPALRKCLGGPIAIPAPSF
jgi:RHS repeat-associated protein